MFRLAFNDLLDVSSFQKFNMYLDAALLYSSTEGILCEVADLIAPFPPLLLSALVGNFPYVDKP